MNHTEPVAYDQHGKPIYQCELDQRRREREEQDRRDARAREQEGKDQ